jgi:hypothetical protein
MFQSHRFVAGMLAGAVLASAVLYLSQTRYGFAQSESKTSDHRDPALASAPGTPVERFAASAGVEAGTRDTSLSDLRAAVLQRVLTPENAEGEGADPMGASAAEAFTRGRKLLDARLAEAPADPRAAARLQQALAPLLTSNRLGEATAELSCNPTMCRVNLIAEDEARVSRAASGLSEQLPKTFASMVAYPDGAGHRSIYFSTNATDLRIDSGAQQAPEGSDEHPLSAIAK